MARWVCPWLCIHFDEQHQGTSPNLTINHLPDELLLGIFDSYRQGIDFYDYQWRKKYVWFNLTHVSRRWRAVIFASSSRMDLGISVGTVKPAHIRPILSTPLPIIFDYKWVYEVTNSALWRMRTVLEQRDRVRGITVGGPIVLFDRLFSVTNYTFPILESLSLSLCSDHHKELELPYTFLGGPDPSNLHLRRLKLERVSLASVTRLLFSTSSLTDLSLRIETAFVASPGTRLLACLQGMPCLSCLNLSISAKSTSLFPAPKDIVSLSKLMRFSYTGHSEFLDAILAGLSAPSLREFIMELFDAISFPILHFTRFITETDEHYRVVDMTFREEVFRLALPTQLDYIPRILYCVCSRIRRWSPESIVRISGSISTKLTTVEELRLTFRFSGMAAEDYILWRSFYQLFPSVQVLHIDGANYDCIASTLLRDHEEPNNALAFLPALEEIQLGDGECWTCQSRTCRSESELAGFQPFISARQRAGRPVKVFFHPQVGIS